MTKSKKSLGYFDEKPRPKLCCDLKKSVTEQAHKNDCDINTIVNRFQKTGVLEHRDEYRGEYGFASATTFAEAMIVVAKGMSMFSDLPSHIRERFSNDPARFLEFVQNEKNAKEMVKLGLATEITDIAANTPQIDPTTLRTALAEALSPEPDTGSKSSPGDGVIPAQGSSD